jgi:hypothetical protein
MKADMLARLLAVARGEFEPAAAARRNGRNRITPKSPEVTPLRPLRPKSDKGENDSFASARTADPASHDSDEAAIEERAGLASDRVPSAYLAAWALLNCQRPYGVTEAVWRQALDDGGCFLDAFGNQAAALGWTPGELFDVTAGLIWRLNGKRVDAIAADRARLSDRQSSCRNTEETQP